MDSASRKVSDGPAAKAEPDLRAEAVLQGRLVARPTLPGRGARKFRPNLVAVWIIAVLAAGSILAVGAALLWTFFGHASDEAAPPAAPPW